MSQLQGKWLKVFPRALLASLYFAIVINGVFAQFTDVELGGLHWLVDSLLTGSLGSVLALLFGYLWFKLQLNRRGGFLLRLIQCMVIGVVLTAGWALLVQAMGLNVMPLLGVVVAVTSIDVEVRLQALSASSPAQ